MKKLYLLGAIALMAATACTSSEEPGGGKNDDPEVSIPRRDIEMSRADAEIINKQTAFAFDLLNKRIAEADANTNVMVAPYSVTTALAMAANGATGQALAEMTEVLIGENASLAELNALNSRLLSELPALDNRVSLKISNSVWAHPAFSFQPEFEKAMTETFAASTHTANFETQAGVDALNDWCNRATEGEITKLMKSPDNVLFLLANAARFEGKWQTAFDKDDTKDAKFTDGAGNAKTVKMMYGSEGMKHYSDADCHIVRLPYGNGAFRMSAILPRGNRTAAEVASMLNIADWQGKYSRCTPARFAIGLPRFKMSNDMDLLGTLRQMGLSHTMSPNCKDFTRMAQASTPDSYLAIKRVDHAATLTVEESGTKGAGATDVGFWEVGSNGNGGGSIEPLEFNRPFVFVIDEVSTGAILFAGVVNRID